MIKNGEEVVGAPLLGGVKVLGSGSGRAMAQGAASLAFGRKRESPLKPRQMAVIALTADDFLVLNFKHGAVHPIATQVMARIPRTEIAGVDVPKALAMNKMTVVFVDGGGVDFRGDQTERRQGSGHCRTDRALQLHVRPRRRHASPLPRRPPFVRCVRVSVGPGPHLRGRNANRPPMARWWSPGSRLRPSLTD